MSFNLDRVVPWGRSFDEYVAMFALSGEDLKKRLLGCGDGPAAFNAVHTSQGGQVVSIDPIYEFSAGVIERRIDETYTEIIRQVREHAGSFVWDAIPTVEALGRVRMEAMQTFLADYPAGRRDNRYLAASLPRLPFEDHAFDLALCSHVLFLYSEPFSLDFHVQSIQELCRVAPEARLFPLLELRGHPSRHLEATMVQLRAQGFQADLLTVPYEFQRGGNQMMRVKRKPEAPY